MKKRFFIISIFCILLIAMAIPCMAATQQVEKTYDPLDLIVIVDSSGSMTSSDPQRTAVAAVRMLVNMMPADSRVGVIGFNTKATVWTQDNSGDPAMLPLESFADAESVRSAISKIQYNGGTGIGNALLKATDLLSDRAKSGRKKAIMLFTDGVDDFGADKLGYAMCQENEVDALQWAKDNNTVIYCVGYNFKRSNGTYSMGPNGEGLVKLENIANTTNGKFRSISTIQEAEQLLVDFLADVCDLNYRPVATLPGDGGYYETKITVSPSVVEANIRIAGGSKDSIKNGEIRLFDPDGREVELRNSGNVRYDVDVNAASIKVIAPAVGDWMLTVKNVSGDDIHIGLLEHFKINLSSSLTFPEGNPKGVAYSNDEIGIKAWLSYDGKDITNVDLYDAVTNATATCISRENPNEKKVVALTRNGLAFEGSFVIPEDAYYDVIIRLEWNSLYREDTQEVKSNNKPVQLIKEIGTVKVNKGKTVSIDNIYQYVKDDENDAVTATVGSSTAPDVATVTINGDQVVITGNKWSSTLATIIFTDAQGNDIHATFKIRVNDPVAIALIIVILAVIAGIVIGGIILAREKSLKIKGDLYLVSIEFDTSDDDDGTIARFDFTEDKDNIVTEQDALAISMQTFYRIRSNRNVEALITKIRDMFNFSSEDSDGATIKSFFAKNSVKTLFNGAKYSKIRGSANGGSFTVKIGRKTPYLRVNRSDKTTVNNNGEITFEFKDRSRSGRRNKVEIVTKFVTPVRTGKSRR